MINQLQLTKEYRYIQYNLNQLKTEEYLGKCAVERAFLKLDLYVINITGVGIV
jgi:hypothetical protein